MKFSLKLLKKFVTLEENPQEIASLLSVSGLEVASVSQLVHNDVKLSGVVVAKILSITAHPNADRLRMAKVSTGSDIYTVVCGAPNIKKNQIIAFVKVGAELCNTSGEKFKIKEAKIRGEKSYGMICSEYEIGIGTEKDDILELDETFSLGKNLEAYRERLNDEILEIEITPNRGDACSHLGVARDLSAILDRQLKKMPCIKDSDINFHENDFSITIEEPELCDIFETILIENSQVKESPFWLRHFLKSVGIRPRHLAVDITNYVMMEIGQPMHAYDFDKIKSKSLAVKTKSSDSVLALDDKERKISQKNLLICDGEDVASIAGVIGEKKHSISDGTTRILFEAANFRESAIRKSSKEISTATESSFRFERGVGDTQKEAILRAAFLLKSIDNSAKINQTASVAQKARQKKQVILSMSRLEKIAGVAFDVVSVKNILERLDFDILEQNDKEIKILAPLAKSDVTREIDVIEEVMRIYGYNKIISEKNHITSPIDSHGSQEVYQKIKSRISSLLVSEGFGEVLTNPLTSSQEVCDNGYISDKNLAKLQNPLSREMDILRPSLFHSLAKAAQFNFHRDQEKTYFFEFGKEYATINNKPCEKSVLGLFYAAKNVSTSWFQKGKSCELYSLFYFLEKMFTHLQISYKREEGKSAFFATQSVEFLAGERVLARGHEVNGHMMQKYDLPKSFFAEILLDELVKAHRKEVTTRSISKFPGCSRDISILMSCDISFTQLKEIIEKKAAKELKGLKLIDIYHDKASQGNKSYTVRLFFQSDSKTLESKFIDQEIKNIEKALCRDLGATIR